MTDYAAHAHNIRREYMAATTEICERFLDVDNQTRIGGLQFVDNVRPHLQARANATEHPDTPALIPPQPPQPPTPDDEPFDYSGSGMPWVEPKDWTAADQAREDGVPDTWLI